MKFKAPKYLLCFISIIALFLWSCITNAATPISTYKGSTVTNTSSAIYSSTNDIFEYASGSDSPHIFWLFQNIGGTETPTVGSPQIYTGTSDWSVTINDSTQTVWKLKKAASSYASIWLNLNGEEGVLQELLSLDIGTTVRLNYSTGEFTINGSVSKPYKTSINMLIQIESLDTITTENAFDNTFGSNESLVFSADVSSASSFAIHIWPTVWVYATGWPPQIPAPQPTPPTNPFIIPSYGSLAGQIVYAAGPGVIVPFSAAANLTREQIRDKLFAAGSQIARHIRNVDLAPGPVNAVQFGKYQSLLKSVLRGGKGFSNQQALEKELARIGIKWLHQSNLALIRYIANKINGLISVNARFFISRYLIEEQDNSCITL